jgi:hypothetical protein
MQLSMFNDSEVGVTRGVGGEVTKQRWKWDDVEEGKLDLQVVDLFSHGARAVEIFGSGCTAYWDMKGYMLVGKPVGIAATELRVNARGEKRLKLLRDYVSGGGRVFVDSGVFGAFRKKLTVNFDDQVFPVYESLLRETLNPGGLMFVAPDAIGNEVETQRLQKLYVDRILGWIDRGAECIFPIQNPNSDVEKEYARVLSLLDGRPCTVGFPSNEHAWQPRQIIEFVKKTKPARIHLLGLADEKMLLQIARDVGVVSSGTSISCDSCILVAHAGHGRRLTDRCHTRMDASVEWLANGAWLEHDLAIPDLSTYVAMVEYDADFVSEEMACEMAVALGCKGPNWATRFIEATKTGMLDVLGPLDPDEEWLHVALTKFVRERMYVPWVRSMLSGPIRSWEVARLACGDDPGWYRIKEDVKSHFVLHSNPAK